jgi:hypothetical protein
LIFAGGILVVLGVRNAFKGATESIGREYGRLAVERRQQSTQQRRASRLAKAGEYPLAVLAVAHGDAATQAHATLTKLVAPTPLGAALISALESQEGPFAGRTAVLIGVGERSVTELDTIVSNTGRKAVVAAFAVGSRGSQSESSIITIGSGDFWTQLDNAIAWAANEIEDGRGDFLAVLLSDPVFGDQEGRSDEADIRRLIRTLFANDSWNLWLAAREPFDTSAWPDRVEIAIPLAPMTLRQAMLNIGLELPRGAIDRDRRLIVTDRAQAAKLLIGIIEADLPPARSYARQLPQYAAEITLALESASREGRAHVERDDSIARESQAFFDLVGIRIASSIQDVARRILPLSIYPARVVAWRRANIERPAALIVTEQSATKLARRWLSEAIQSADESVAAAVLADHGRVWLEDRDWGACLELVRDAARVFQVNTRAHLWAHYLLALDSALRLNRPDATWFVDEKCEIADTTELGLLFRVERMEFRRLRGDLDSACSDLNRLFPELIVSTDNGLSSPATYALGTARFVAANTLRRGGRYDNARALIDSAVATLNRSIPAHHVELTHCTYALSVCDSIRGIAAVRAADEWPPSQAIFARSLVTLANSHASWFIEDYTRAIEFANEAEGGFGSIGYNRYAARAGELASLLSDWAARSGRFVGTATHVPNVTVDELLSVPEGGRFTTLMNLRPSRALSLLQFATRFLDDPNLPRTVVLPRFIGLTGDGSFALYNLPASASFKEAEHRLRAAIGVGAELRVPLAAD